MPYWSIYLHYIWTTKQRPPLLKGEVAALAERSLRAKCSEHRAIVHALYRMPDHVHLAVSIPPALAPATLVAKLKGSSSHLIRHTPNGGNPDFAWQGEYGVLSIGEKQLPDLVRYIENQPSRHAERRTWAKLERCAPDPQPASAGFVDVARGFSPVDYDGTNE